MSDEYEQQLGKALCDRAGLDPNRVMREFDSELISSGEVMVTLQVMTFIPVDELAELEELARQKATK